MNNKYYVKDNSCVKDFKLKKVIFLKKNVTFLYNLNGILIKKQNNIIGLEEYLKLIGEVYINIFITKFNYKI